MDFYTVVTPIIFAAVVTFGYLEARKYNRHHTNFDLAYACLLNCIPRFRDATPDAILKALENLEAEAIFSRHLSVSKSLSQFSSLGKIAAGIKISAKDQIQLLDIMTGVSAPDWFYTKNIPERSIVETVGLAVKATATTYDIRCAHMLLLAD